MVIKMARWYSEEMKEFHNNNKTDEYFLYHWHYIGKTVGWDPAELQWGYIGIAPYANIPERYRLEREECKSGSRKRMRTVIVMLNRFQDYGKLGFKIIAKGLTRKNALHLEGLLRPKDWVHETDRRIWNEVAGG